MLYHLLGAAALPDTWPELFRYISIRSAGAALTAFLLCLLLGPAVIARLRALRVGERTEKSDSDVLAEMNRSKRGTPTMGGLFLCGSLLISFLLWGRFDNRYALVAVAVVAGFGVVGFVDDWIKLKDPGRKGLSARWKLWPLAAVGAAAGIGLVWVARDMADPQAYLRLYFPFVRGEGLALDWWMAAPFVVLAVLVLAGSANAVNLTDGLDGLAAGCVAAAGLAFAGLTYVVGHRELAEYLQLLHVPGAGEMTVLCAALVGAALGFLWFNAAPAQVFMGDVGSLPLGGVLGYAAMVSRMELVLFVVGGIFVVEALSVMAQVLHFKCTGRRILRCAPLHHHFQFAGMPETRIVARFWIIAGLLALASLALFRVR